MSQIVWVSRAKWGSSKATEDFIARRDSIPAEDLTSIQIHHTAAIDGDDSTPNRWDYEEAVAYIRRLQTSRPELGPLPYSENLAVSEDLSTVWLFEGRGILKRGAHTAEHNRDGVGWGIFGNFDKRDDPAALALIGALEWRTGKLREELLPNLGTQLNPKGWQAWGHRDSSPKSCPGNYLYPLLEGFEIGGDDMTPAEVASATWSAFLGGRVGSSNRKPAGQHLVEANLNARAARDAALAALQVSRQLAAGVTLTPEAIDAIVAEIEEAELS